MTGGRLDRLRVVVTRPREQAAPLVSALETLGADVVLVPTIRIDDPPDGGLALRAGLRALGADDWVVITSPNGAARVGRIVAETPLAAGVKVAVIGSGTKARAEAEGLTVDLVPDEAIAEGLAARFPARPSTGGRVLLARAEVARETLPLQLAFMGWNVDDVVAYRTVPVDIDEDAKSACRSADAVIFTSGSTVESLVTVVGLEGLPPTVFTIGPATAEVATHLGVGVDVVAAEHSIPGLVDAMQAHYANRPYVHAEDPASTDAQQCLQDYVAEVARRLDGAVDLEALPIPDADGVMPPNRRFLVARLDGRAVGCGGLDRMAPDTADIKHLWVSTDVRRRGIGRALLEHLIVEARRLECRWVRLDADPIFTEAVSLLRSAGFVDESDSDDEDDPQRRFTLDLD